MTPRSRKTTTSPPVPMLQMGRGFEDRLRLHSFMMEHRADIEAGRWTQPQFARKATEHFDMVVTSSTVGRLARQSGLQWGTASATASRSRRSSSAAIMLVAEFVAEWCEDPDDAATFLTSVRELLP